VSADLGYGRGIAIGDGEFGLDGDSSSAKQLRSVRGGDLIRRDGTAVHRQAERRHRPDSLACDVQWLTARSQDREPPALTHEHVRQASNILDQVLTVVEDQRT